MRSDKEIEDAILAVCTLAGTNFPAATDIRISTDGPSSASVTIPYYAMVGIMEMARRGKEISTPVNKAE